MEALNLHQLIYNNYSYSIICKYIKKNNWEVNNKLGQLKQSPLLVACCIKSDYCVNILGLLIINGANINDTDIDGNNAIHTLLQYNHSNEECMLDIIKYLLSYGVNVFHKNNNKNTAVDFAYTRKYEKVMKFILKYQKAVNI